jgi:hypothetical protein
MLNQVSLTLNICQKKYVQEISLKNKGFSFFTTELHGVITRGYIECVYPEPENWCWVLGAGLRDQAVG